MAVSASNEGIQKTSATTFANHVFSGGGTTLSLKVDGVANGSQTLLNLVSGTGITLSDDGSGDVTINADGGGVSLSQDITQASHGFVVGNVIKHASGVYALADKDSVSDAEALGLVTAVVTANIFTLTTSGFVDTLSGLSADTQYFLGSAGVLTSTIPTTVGDVVKPIFFAINSSSGYFINYRGELLTTVTSPVTSVAGTTNRITVTGTTSVVVDIAATYVGQTSITTLGTVTTGTLSTGAVIAGVTMTLGSDGTGDIYYRAAGGVLTRLAIGSAGKVLTVSGGLPSWQTASGGSGGISLLGARIPGGLIFTNQMGHAVQDPNIIWDRYAKTLTLTSDISNAQLALYVSRNIGGGSNMVQFDMTDNTNAVHSVAIGSDSGRASFGTTTNNDLGIGTNNSFSQLYLKATGNVGIGTNNPTSLFSVGSSSQFQVTSSGGILGSGVLQTNLTKENANLWVTSSSDVVLTSSSQFRLSSNTNMVMRAAFYGSSVTTNGGNTDNVNVVFANSAQSTGNGVHRLAANVGIAPPSISVAGNPGNGIANAATLFVQGVPTAGSNNAGILIGLPSDSLNDFTLGASSTLGVNTYNAYLMLANSGNIGFLGNSSGMVSIKPQDDAGFWTLTLPMSGGRMNQVLTTDGSGLTSWKYPVTDYKYISLFDYYTNAGNGTTVETDLYTSTTAANTLRLNGEKLSIEYAGSFVSSATATRQLKLYFGGTVIFDSGALTLSLSSQWVIYATIIRVSATVIRYLVSMTTEGAALAAYTASGEVTGLTLSNTNILKITGQAAGVGAATNDIVASMGTVAWVQKA